MCFALALHAISRVHQVEVAARKYYCSVFVHEQTRLLSDTLKAREQLTRNRQHTLKVACARHLRVHSLLPIMLCAVQNARAGPCKRQKRYPNETHR